MSRPTKARVMAMPMPIEAPVARAEECVLGGEGEGEVVVVVVEDESLLLVPRGLELGKLEVEVEVDELGIDEGTELVGFALVDDVEEVDVLLVDSIAGVVVAAALGIVTV